MKSCACGRTAVLNGLCWTCYVGLYSQSNKTVNHEPKEDRPVCIKEGCGRKPHSRGLCSRCYQEWRTSPTNYDPKYGLPERPKCKVEGCDGLLFGREMCAVHYRRFMKHGSVERGVELTPDQKRQVLKVVHDLVDVLGPVDLVQSAELNGSGVVLTVRFEDGTERQCKLTIA